MAYERTCIVDNTKYEYCSNCNRFNSLETWRYIFCCENCRNIWKITEKYIGKKITAQEAKKLLKECDLASIDNSTGNIKSVLSEILSTKTIKENKIEEKVEEKGIEQSNKNEQTENNTTLEVNVDEVVSKPVQIRAKSKSKKVSD